MASAFAPGQTQTVDTGGVNVAVTFTQQDANATAFVTNVANNYKEAGEPFDSSILKLLDTQNDDGKPATSAVEVDFSSASKSFGDEVKNVSFRINDIDTKATGGDLGANGTGGFLDHVTVAAFDAQDNPISVKLTPATDVAVSGNSASGTTDATFGSAKGSVLVEIDEPVSRIKIFYKNELVEQQAIGISDIHFTAMKGDDQNLPPVANDDTATTDEDVAVEIDVLANDTDPENDPLTVISATSSNASIQITADNRLIYTPNADFSGPDTVTYTIRDTAGNEATGQVAVQVDPRGDGGNADPVARDDTATTGLGDPVTITVLANDEDPDGDPLTVTGIGTDPTNGTVTINGDGTLTYVPEGTFRGTDTFTYTIEDGNGGTAEATVTIDVGLGRIDTDVFPVPAGLQGIDPLNGLDEDPDPLDDAETVNGTTDADTISTGDDADTIFAGAGDDSVRPGIDDDTVRLGTGDDTLFDVQGADTIFGGQGDDSIVAGTNTFSDYEGDDPRFAPGAPLNAVFGFTSDPNQEDGRDYVEGNRGNDYIATGDDRDTIDGGGENDTLDGGIDDDSIMGGQGDDSLLGGHGSDTLDGGQGNDFLDGSHSGTIVDIDLQTQQPIVIDLETLEIIDANDPNTENDRDLLNGALGDDTIFGGDDDDTLFGGSGNDVLDGGIDDDSIHGGNDDDTLIGGQGNDTLNGGSGVDSIDGGADRDVIVVDSAADGIGDHVDGGSGGFVEQDDPSLPPNQDYDILDLSGVGQKDVDWRLAQLELDSNENGLDGIVEFLDGNGTVTGTMRFEEIEEIVPCFTPGTMIATPEGERRVEELQPGDRVITRDNGIQTLVWVGHKALSAADLGAKPHMNPVLIRKGALGRGLPDRDILVSPNHRVLVANEQTTLYFEEREVLVAAKHLTHIDGIDRVEAAGVEYVHIMFAQHEVVLSNGAWTESFQPGDYTMKGIGSESRAEILELFPELAEAEGIEAYGAARRSLKKHEAALLS